MLLNALTELLFFGSVKRAAVLVKGGNGKADELTFEQPEETAFFRRSKTGRFSPLYDFKPGAFAPKKVVPRVIFMRSSQR